jgi:hypothetical protein
LRVRLRAKNEQYYRNGLVVSGNDQYISFILVKCKHE